MSDKTKKRLMIGAAIVAVIIFLLMSRGGQLVSGGGAMPSVVGPGGITLNRSQGPGLRDLNIPPPWSAPARPCKCGCDDYGMHSGNFALMSMPPNAMAAMMGVF